MRLRAAGARQEDCAVHRDDQLQRGAPRAAPPLLCLQKCWTGKAAHMLQNVMRDDQLPRGAPRAAPRARFTLCVAECAVQLAYTRNIGALFSWMLSFPLRMPWRTQWVLQALACRAGLISPTEGPDDGSLVACGLGTTTRACKQHAAACRPCKHVPCLAVRANMLHHQT